MAHVIHFEIHADEPERAVAFYTNVFGWQFRKWKGNQEYWSIDTGGESRGINGGLVRRTSTVKEQSIMAFVCTVDVPDIDLCIKRVLENGGSVALEKVTLFGAGYLAYCKDTEGNVFGLNQADPNAQDEDGSA